MANTCPHADEERSGQVHVAQFTSHSSATICPRSGSGNEGDRIHLTLYNSNTVGTLSSLVGETLGMSVLDSACTKTVTGESWTNAYLDTLTDKQRQQVKVVPSNVHFRHGDGNDVISNKVVKFPAVLGNQKVFIEANIVANETPMLMSRSFLKKAQMIINFDDDMAQILGNQVKLNCTSTGHYCIPLTKLLLSDKDSSQSPVVLHTTTIKNATRKELIDKAVKVHRQFSHASKEKLCKLLKQSPGFDNEEFLDTVKEQYDLCEVC